MDRRARRTPTGDAIDTVRRVASGLHAYIGFCLLLAGTLNIIPIIIAIIIAIDRAFLPPTAGTAPMASCTLLIASLSWLDVGYRPTVFLF